MVNQIFDEPITKVETEPKEVWKERTKNSSDRYKVGGVDDKPPTVVYPRVIIPRENKSIWTKFVHNHGN